jgi:hypothetical protein
MTGESQNKTRQPLLSNGMVNVSVAMNQHATIVELLEVVFTVWSTLRPYSKDQWEN